MRGCVGRCVGWMRAHPQYGLVADSAFGAGGGNGALFVHFGQVLNGVRGWVGPERLPQSRIALPLHSSAQELRQLQPLALQRSEWRSPGAVHGGAEGF